MKIDQIKENFSKNLITLRKMNNLTQLALAEKLNYSDKAISKWEVGSVLPDVETMVKIAEFFGIPLNDLIYPKKEKLPKRFFKNHLFISLLSFGLVWFLSTIVFFVLDVSVDLDRVWLVFIFTIPLSFVVLIVFTAIWFRKLWLFLSITGFFWGVLVSIYLFISDPKLWFIFIIGVVGQVLITLLAQLTHNLKIW